jgi:Tfp pilus assembly protein PilF
MVRDVYTLPIDVDVQTVFPHAHSLSREILLQAELPDGSVRTLISIKRFDENWHDTYRFAKPVRLPKGTRLVTRFSYDNSVDNIRNPHQPPQRVVYGSNADDEIAGKKPELAIELFKGRPQQLERSTKARTIVGMAYLAKHDLESAKRQFQQLLAQDSQLPTVWLGLGQVHAQSGEPNDAELALRRSIRFAPRMTVARLDLVDLLVSQERFEEAIAQCEMASELEPGAHQPHLKLADIYARQKRYDESLEQFQRARRLAPFVYSPAASLAIACYQHGNETKAKSLLGEAVAMDSDDPVPHCFLGQIARRDEQWQTAKEQLRQALELPIPDTWPASHVRQFLTLIYAELLQLAEQIGDESLARSAAEGWLKIEPDKAGLKELLQVLSR